MAYEYDVFVSYKRHHEWPIWVREVFYDILNHWLNAEMAEGCRVFVDYQLEEGQNWPGRLADILSRSKVIVPLWSPQYFTSNWCLAEMALFAAREQATGFGTPGNPQRLIIPAAIHDGDSFPQDARLIQFRAIQPLCNIRIAKGGFAEERLSDEIRNWVPNICAAIRQAPEYDPNWRIIAHNNFMDLFRNPPMNPELPRL
jgi:hypothetical protein